MNDALFHFSDGCTRWSQGDLSGAALRFRQAIKHDPGLAIAHANLGLLLIAQQRYAEAIAPLEAARATNAGAEPNEVMILQNLAVAYARGGVPERAGEAWDAALAVLGSDPRQKFDFACKLQEAGRGPAAVDLFVAVIDDPECPADLRGAARLNALFFLVANEDWERVEAVACKALGEDPTSDRFHYDYLAALIGLGHFELAKGANSAYLVRRVKPSQAAVEPLAGSEDQAALAAAASELEALLVRIDAFPDACKVYDELLAPLPPSVVAEARFARFDFDRNLGQGLMRLPEGMDRAGFEAARARRRGLAGPDSVRYPLVHTLCVRNEREIIEANLAWHFAQGADCALVTDNGSIDGTRDLLEELAARWPILVIDEPVQDLNQTLWTTRMGLLAGDLLGADWVILGDADEFWRGRKGDLKASLAAAGSGRFAGAGQFFWRSILMLPERAAGMREDYDFSRATRAFVWPFGNLDYHYMQPDKSLSFLLTQAHKAWVRPSALRLVAPGNHHAILENAPSGYGTEIECLHYHLRSFAEYRRKLEQQAAALARSTNAVHRQLGSAITTAVETLAASDGYEARYAAQTWPTPFYQYAEQAGRIETCSVVADFLPEGRISATQWLAKGPGPLAPDLVARCRRWLDGVDMELPHFS